MANPYLILWCDPTANKIYSGWQKNTQAATPILKQGDQIGVEIHWVKSGQYTSMMQEVQFPPSATVRLAVGRLDASPTAGTFTLTYGANTTAPLAYNITATELQTALNGLASITADGGVTVSKSGNQFKLAWNNVGAHATALTSNTDMLYPTSQTSIVESRAGSVSVSRIILLKVRQSAVAAQTSFTATESPSITVSSLFTSTWRVSISPMPKDGVFSLTITKGASTYTTISIPCTADSFTMSSALNSLNVVSGQKFSVIKSGDFAWDITAPSAVDSITATSGLVGFSSVYGILDMNTAQVDEFLSGSSSGDATVEVEVDVAGEIQTLVQTRVTILNDLIDQSSFNIVSMGDLMPVDSVVRYDTSQALSSAQKLTARQNIGAASLSDVSDAFDFDNIPTLNEKNAMQNSVLPSTSNPFVTMSERNPFDQSLNTDDSVQFNDVTVSDGTNSIVVSSTGVTFPDSTIQTTAADPTAYLTKAGNLTGLTNVSTARTNLGLGTMAVETAANYLAKADNLSGLASASTARTNLGLGTMAVESSASYLAKADNLSGLTSTSTARSNLGLGTMATETATNYLSKSGNLSGLSDTSVSRNNLGLGTGNNVQFAGATVSSVTFSTNSTVQSIAGPPAPMDTSKSYLAIWNGSAWDTTNSYQSGQLFYNAGGHCADFGTYIGNDGGPAVRVSMNEFTTWTELFSGGIRFPDGTIQSSASTGGELHNINPYTWTGYSSMGWTFTNNNSIKKAATSSPNPFDGPDFMVQILGIASTNGAAYGKVVPLKIQATFRGGDELTIGLFGGLLETTRTDIIFAFSESHNGVQNYHIKYFDGSTTSIVDTGIANAGIGGGGIWQKAELSMNSDAQIKLTVLQSGGTSTSYTISAPAGPYVQQAIKSKFEDVRYAGARFYGQNTGGSGTYYPSFEIGAFNLTWL